MTDRNPVVIRIEFEYADGTIRRAVGPDADAISQAISGAFAFQQVHGIRYDGPVMVEVRPANPAVQAPSEPAPCPPTNVRA